MIPAYPLLFSCPRCGQPKAITNITSGNTFGGTWWSDAWHHYPMLPEPSPVQHCASCGHYYFLYGLKPLKSDEWIDSDLGDLSYSECLEALEQFTSFADEDDEITLRLLTLHSFNSEHHRLPARCGRPSTAASPEHAALFRSNAERLLELCLPKENMRLLCVEIMRELGRFREACELLAGIGTSSGISQAQLDQFREHIRNQDPHPFKLK